MTKAKFEYWLQEVGYRTREQMKQNMILPTDSYEQCKEKLCDVDACFSSQSTKMWEYFKDVYSDIPVQYRMPLMLEVVFQNSLVNYTEMLQYISNYLNNEETTEMKQKRVEANKKLLKNHLRDDGAVRIYRGCAEYFIMPEYAVSYSLSEDVAKFFVDYHKVHHKSRFGAVAWDNVKLEDVLFYSDDRQEQEVFVIPYAIRGGKTVESGDDIDRLDEYFMCMYFEEAEDIAIIEALEEEKSRAV